MPPSLVPPKTTTSGIVGGFYATLHTKRWADQKPPRLHPRFLEEWGINARTPDFSLQKRRLELSLKLGTIERFRRISTTGRRSSPEFARSHSGADCDFVFSTLSDFEQSDAQVLGPTEKMTIALGYMREALAAKTLPPPPGFTMQRLSPTLLFPPTQKTNPSRFLPTAHRLRPWPAISR
ncbi:MAG: hypothetical protein R3C68_13535 [Myxococcota bacterium]